MKVRVARIYISDTVSKYVSSLSAFQKFYSQKGLIEEEFDNEQA